MTIDATGGRSTLATPSGEPAADPERVTAHGQRREKQMQDGHRQSPLLRVASGPTLIDADDAVRGALEDLQDVLERHLSHLPSCEWRDAFVKMNLAASRSLGQPPLRLLQPAGLG